VLELLDSDGQPVTIKDSDDNAVSNPIDIDLELYNETNPTQILPSDIEAAIRLKLANFSLASGNNTGKTLADAINVSYELEDRTLSFRPSSIGFDKDIAKIGVSGGTVAAPAENKLLGFSNSATPESVGSSSTIDPFKGAGLVPNGEFRLDPDRQRSGIKVEYRSDERRFIFSSGTTGEQSEIDIQAVYEDAEGNIKTPEEIKELTEDERTALVSRNQRAIEVFGIGSDAPGAEKGKGLAGTPATTTGSRTGVDTT
jgi:hypothetical protein